MFKIIILGSSGVGKTSMMLRFAAQVFEKSFRPTLGADFMKKKVTIDGVEYTLQLWDTAGQERFQGLCTALFHGADACVLVYDITSESSFNDLKNWKDSFLATLNPDFNNFIVVGNKSDQEEFRVVSKRRAKLWCYGEGIKSYYETSALEGVNIDEAFLELTKIVVSQQNSLVSSSKNIKIEDLTIPDDESCFCS